MEIQKLSPDVNSFFLGRMANKFFFTVNRLEFKLVKITPTENMAVLEFQKVLMNKLTTFNSLDFVQNFMDRQLLFILKVSFKNKKD